jgi:hypothetical protein
VTDAPLFFERIMVDLFGASQRLAREVWKRYPASTELAFQLHLCNSPAMSPDAVIARVKHAADLLSPQLLIRCLERMTEERGRQRKDVTRLQERILQLLDSRGCWKWYN